MTFNEHSFVGKLLYGIASATILGGGTMVANLSRNDAVQNERIEQIEKASEKMEALSDKLDTTNTKVDVLNARLDEKEKARVSSQ